MWRASIFRYFWSQSRPWSWRCFKHLWHRRQERLTCHTGNGLNRPLMTLGFYHFLSSLPSFHETPVKTLLSSLPCLICTGLGTLNTLQEISDLQLAWWFPARDLCIDGPLLQDQVSMQRAGGVLRCKHFRSWSRKCKHAVMCSLFVSPQLWYTCLFSTLTSKKRWMLRPIQEFNPAFAEEPGVIYGAPGP